MQSGLEVVSDSKRTKERRSETYLRSVLPSFFPCFDATGLNDSSFNPPPTFCTNRVMSDATIPSTHQILIRSSDAAPAAGARRSKRPGARVMRSRERAVRWLKRSGTEIAAEGTAKGALQMVMLVRLAGRPARRSVDVCFERFTATCAVPSAAVLAVSSPSPSSSSSGGKGKPRRICRREGGRVVGRGTPFFRRGGECGVGRVEGSQTRAGAEEAVLTDSSEEGTGECFLLDHCREGKG